MSEKSVEVNFVFADAVERGKDLPSQANALGAPFGEEEENRGRAVVGVDAWGFVGSK